MAPRREPKIVNLKSNTMIINSEDAHERFNLLNLNFQPINL